MSRFIDFEGVKGFASYEIAKKKGEAVAAEVAEIVGQKDAYRVRWMIIALESGRFVPAFRCCDVVQPGYFLGRPNICMM